MKLFNFIQISILMGIAALVGCAADQPNTNSSNTSDLGTDTNGNTDSHETDTGETDVVDSGSDSIQDTNPEGPDTSTEVDENSYGVSDEDGNVNGYPNGTIPPGDPGSQVHIENLDGNTVLIPGGSNLYTGDVVGGPAKALAVGFEQFGGFFTIDLTDQQANTHPFSLLMNLGQNVTETELTMILVPVLPDDTYGQRMEVACTVKQVGHGELQVSLSWSKPVDLDLHLVEPGGEEIYYGHKHSESGGTMDLDSNTGCSMDYANAENINYNQVSPPSGRYTVRVDFWSDCGSSTEVRYTATVNIHGTPISYTGVFEKNSFDQGGLGSGETVVEFEFEGYGDTDTDTETQ